MASVRCANSSCAARSFVNIAHRSTIREPVALAPLDFLHPRHASVAVRQHPSVKVTRPASSLRLLRSRFTDAQTISRRKFTTSAPRQATICTQNPQTDEEGSPMTLEITTRAAKRLSQIMTKDKNPNLALRIQVESGGCHGFQYLMSLITIPSEQAAETSSVVNEDDTIFQYMADEGSSTEVNGPVPTIILDEPSLDLLKGSKVDFTQELIGSQFKIVDNPYATSSCGCGTSFDIKT